MKIVKKTDKEYPLRMKRLSQMPELLYVRGNLPADDKPSVAIVGARSCSNYGRNMASEFARVLSQEGVQIISGLALGIDGEAHVGAMKGNTPTYAVLANDVCVCYPRANQRIYNKILESGEESWGNSQKERMPNRTFFRQETGLSVLWRMSFWLWRRGKKWCTDYC